MRTPRSLDLAITHHCNLRCKYCSYFTSAGDVPQDLPGEAWTEFFQELNACAVMEVCLSGGEPFSRRDLRELIEAIIRNRMRFLILSNGTLITDEMASFLASTRRCSGIQVSIDGSIPTTHDACRGEGNFLKAIEGIQCLLRHHLPATVRVTIHKHNVGDLEGIAHLLLEEIGLGGRLEMFEIAASDAPKWVAAVKEMTQRVEALGPNPLRRGQHLHPDAVEQLENMVQP